MLDFYGFFCCLIHSYCGMLSLNLGYIPRVHAWVHPEMGFVGFFMFIVTPVFMVNNH